MLPLSRFEDHPRRHRFSYPTANEISISKMMLGKTVKNVRCKDETWSWIMAQSSGYRKSPARLRSEANRRMEQRAEAQEAHDARWEYWTEPDGRSVCFNWDNWSSARIAEYKAEVRAAYAAANPTPEISVEKEQPRRGIDLSYIMLIIAISLLVASFAWAFT